MKAAACPNVRILGELFIVLVPTHQRRPRSHKGGLLSHNENGPSNLIVAAGLYGWEY